MPAHRSTQSRRLTTAGLIVFSASSLLMMAWAIFPSAAFANVPRVTQWTGNGSNNLPCSGTTHWIFSGWGNDFGEVVGLPTLTVNGQQFGMQQQGNGNVFEAFVPGPLAANPTASAAWTWNENGDEPTPVLTISGCTPSTTTTSTTTTSTTSTGTTSTSSTTATTTSGTTSTSTTPGGSTTSTTETDTTTTDTVSPTTITPTSTTPDQVSPTTVTPGGTAFTGVENVVPLGAIALFLATGGTGLLWAGARRRRDDSGDEE